MAIGGELGLLSLEHRSEASGNEGSSPVRRSQQVGEFWGMTMFTLGWHLGEKVRQQAEWGDEEDGGRA